MKFLSFVIILILVFGYSSSAFAFTSFALYGPQIFYGMNFDYFSIPLKFWIESNLGMNIFHLSFLYDQTIDDPEYKGYFAKTCGMNSKGLFCASQEIEPHIEGQKHAGRSEVHIDDQYDAISKYFGVDQIKQTIKGKKWIQFIGPSIHNLFADIQGNAMVTETDNNENFVTWMDNEFIVMSNFSNHGMAGKSYQEAVGAGADRYIAAHDYILENMNSFSVDQGFRLLEKVSLNEKDCSTQCSMIFLPQTNHIYICVYQDFKTLWKVSLENKTIETHQGGNPNFQARLGKTGILASDLKSLA
ncbi:MAG: hypothetical protein HUN05_05365 [Desulfobacter sp.]|nr:MAG: hypothetical protein HUN05_05365 [Desulfobacter sp.]